MERHGVEIDAGLRPARRVCRPRGGQRIAACAAVALQACTSVTIHAGDGSVSTVRSFGLLNVSPQPGTTPMVLRGISLGLQSGPLGHSLGFSSTQLTLLPAGCHVVVNVGAGAGPSSAALRDLLRSDPCLNLDQPEETP